MLRFVHLINLNAYLNLVTLSYVALKARDSCFLHQIYTILQFHAALWQREDAAQLHQFILHAALDIVQDLAWTTSAMWVIFSVDT